MEAWHMKKKIVLALMAAMMVGTSICSARIANWRIAYDGYQTPDGVTVGMPATVLNDVYGKADWAGPSKRAYERGITLYDYAPEDRSSSTLLEFGVNDNGCIQFIGLVRAGR